MFALPLWGAVAVSVNPSTATVKQGATQQFTAAVTGTTTTGVTWKVSAGGGTVSTSGLYQAPSTAGTYTVTATSKADTTKNATATVTVPLVSVSISPTTANVNQGGTQQFSAMVGGAANTGITWTVIPSTGAGSVGTSGLYTAPAAMGSFKVQATSKAKTTVYAEATVTVSDVIVSVSPTTATIAQGTSQTFAATVVGAANAGVTWTATGGTITTAGVYTASSSAGTYTITATSKANTAKKATASVAVPMRVTVSPAAPTLNQGATQTFTATVTGSTNKTVNWSVSPGGGSITSGGLYTAPVTAGSYTVTATTAAAPSATATANVTVTGVAVTVSPTTATTPIGGMQAFTASVVGSTNKSVSWVCSSGSISNGGVFTAPGTTGTSTVTATSVADPTKSAAVSVAIIPRVTVWDAPTELWQGSSYPCSAVVDGTADGRVSWSSSAGTIDATGLFTAPNVAGSVTITATSIADPRAKGTAIVSVTLVTITISPSTTTQPAGSDVYLSGNVSGTSDSGMTWSITSGGGSIVDLGNGQAVYYTPYLAGTGKVKVTSTAAPTKSATATITITASSQAVIRSFTATPTRIQPGGSVQLIGDFGNGTGVVQPGNLAMVAGTPITVTPGSTTHYVLTVTGSGGSATSSATVGVTGPGHFSALAQPSLTWSNFAATNARTLVDRNGRVLLLGGSQQPPNGIPVQRFDPATGAWTLIGSITADPDLWGYNAAILPDDRIVIVGGRYSNGGSSYWYSNEMRVFDPRNGTTTTGWGYGRYLRDVSVTLLADGRLLLAGGYGVPPNVTYCYYCEIPYKWAGIFDPMTSAWTTLSDMNQISWVNRAVPLPDGRVLMLGKNALEVLDPLARTFTLLGTPALELTSGILRADGKVVLRGKNPFGDFQFGLYNPATNQVQWGSETHPQSYYSGLDWIIALSDDSMLVGDWNSPWTVLDPYSFKIFTSADSNPGPADRLPLAPAQLPSGKVLAMAGEPNGDGYYHITTMTFDREAALAVTPAKTLHNLGLPLQFTATGSAATSGVTWTSSGGTIATDGTFTANQVGIYLISASAASGPVAHAWVKVVPAVSVTIPTLDRRYHAGVPWKLSATVWNHPVAEVTWSLQEGTAAGSITTDGTYTAATAGVFHVVATSMIDPSRSAMKTITAMASISLSIAPQQVTLFAGQRVTFRTQESSGDDMCAFSATGGMIVPGPDVDGVYRGHLGLYTAPETTGNYTVTAVSQMDPSKSVAASVTVIPIESIFLTPTNLLAKKGDVIRFRAWVRTALGVQDVTDQVTWSRTNFYSNPSIYLAPLTPGIFEVQALLAEGSVSAAGVVTVLPDEAFATAGGGSAFNRSSFTMTRLLNGQILIAGGGTTSADLYEPTTKTFTVAPGAMTSNRNGHGAALLPDGRVLLVGGGSATAELFNPVTGLFTPSLGSPRFKRSFPLMAGLPDGRVLIAGTDGYSDKSMEIFDPSTEQFVPAGFLKHASPVSCLLLEDGRVMFAGSTNLQPDGWYGPSMCEMFDFRQGLTTDISPMNRSRRNFSMIQAADAKVWALGGYSDDGSHQGTPTAMEALDPQTNQWSLGPNLLGVGAGATQLVDGSIWFASASIWPVSYGEYVGMRFFPLSGVVEPARHSSTGTQSILLQSGDLLIAGTASGVWASKLHPGDLAKNMVVLPRRITLLAGCSWPLQASTTGLPNAGFTWVVQEGANGGAVTNLGVYTAPFTAGTYHIVATSIADWSIQATAVVDVIQGVQVMVAPALVQVVPGGQIQFTASVAGTPDTGVTWTASAGAISANGLLTAPSTAGTIMVTAMSMAEPSRSASATVVVKSGGGSIPAPVISNFSADATLVSLGQPVNLSWQVVGAYDLILEANYNASVRDVSGLSGYSHIPTGTTTYQLKAANPSGGASSQVITVNVSNAPVAISIAPTTATLFVGQALQFGYSQAPTTRKVWSCTGGTITQGGLFTAPATPGSYQVIVTSVDDPTKSASATVTVNALNLSITPTTATLISGQTQQFGYFFDGPPDAALTWSASGGTISLSGLYTAPITAGTYTVTLACPSFNLTSTATVTVNPIIVTVAPTAVTLLAGQPQQFGGGPNFSSGIWSVVEPNGGTITQSGLYTAPGTPGTYTVQMASQIDPAMFARAVVTVNAISITIDPTQVTLEAGESMQFGATSNAGTLTWTATGGTVWQNGLYKAPLAPGSYIVSVQSVLDSTQKASSQVSVVPASAMRMTPIEFTAKTGDTVQLNLVGVAVGSTITWTVAHSEDGTPGGGTVDANGLFTAGSQPGLFIVRASAGSDSVSGAATIIAQQITPVDALVSLGGTCAFSTATYDSSNSVNWSILEPAGGTITSSGLYTAPLQQGQYHVLAQTSQGHIAMATVTVGPPDGFILSPEIDVLLAGTYQVQVRLKASNGQTTRSIFSGDLPLGVSSPNVVFSQDKIKKDLGVDGPYSVDQVVLSQLVTDELLKVDNKEALGMTGNYPIAEADIPWILIGTIQSIVAEDSNGNGLIDTFHVPISVDVIFDGDYPITATLTCGNGSEIASTQLLPRLLKGKNVITLSFDGRQIYQSGQEGPYGIGNFSVSGPVTRSQSFPGAFAGYSRIQFEH